MLSTGAEMRVTGRVDDYAVVCVNGGQAREVEGTWSASIEWLVDRLAPRLPELGFAEVRYRVKSWKQLESCFEDARAAVREVGAPRVALLGFSMGGAVSIAIADEPRVEEVVGLAPWIPDQLDSARSAGSGSPCSTARSTAGCPGSPACPRRTRSRASTAPANAESRAATTLIPGALHGIALRSPWGSSFTLPKRRPLGRARRGGAAAVVSSRLGSRRVAARAGLPTAS